MADGVDERDVPPEAAAGAIHEENVTPASNAEAAVPEDASPDQADEMAQQATQPLLPAVESGGVDEDAEGSTLPGVRLRQLQAQAEEEARLLSQILGERAGAPERGQDELLEAVTRERMMRLLGERVTRAQPPALLTIWWHEVLVAHWRAFAALEDWSVPISRVWEHTEQQLAGLHEQLERWLPDHPYVDEIINLADDMHGPARWFRRFLLKSERSFAKWLQPVAESEEVVVDVLALTRYATAELERVLPWFTLQHMVLETEIQPDQWQLIEALGGVRAITALIREAFSEHSREIRILGLASGASGGGRLELELARQLGKDWRLAIQATDPDTATTLRSLAGARVAFRQAQARGELAPESTFLASEAQPYDLGAWEPGAFDLVVMTGGLHHLRLADQARCLVEAQRVGRLVMLLEPLYGEEEQMKAFCRPLVRDGEREPAALAQLSGWARRAPGKSGERAMLHASGARDACISCARALSAAEMRRLVAASGTNYTVRPLDDGKLVGRPQWLAIVGSSG
jgi:hypothetical protein